MPHFRAAARYTHNTNRTLYGCILRQHAPPEPGTECWILEESTRAGACSWSVQRRRRPSYGFAPRSHDDSSMGGGGGGRRGSQTLPRTHDGSLFRKAVGCRSAVADSLVQRLHSSLKISPAGDDLFMRSSMVSTSCLTRGIREHRAKSEDTILLDTPNKTNNRRQLSLLSWCWKRKLEGK